MTLDRGTLARIDRRIFAQLDGDGRRQLAKIPVSDAIWDVWHRYCRRADVTMGEGLAALLVAELATEVGEEASADSVLGKRIETNKAAINDATIELHRQLTDAKVKLTQRDGTVRQLQRQVLALREQLHVLEQQVMVQATRQVPLPAPVGRNDRCPCGSGLKYKHCQPRNHGGVSTKRA